MNCNRCFSLCKETEDKAREEEERAAEEAWKAAEASWMAWEEAWKAADVQIAMFRRQYSEHAMQMPDFIHKGVICGKKGPLGMECSRCGEDSGGRYL